MEYTNYKGEKKQLVNLDHQHLSNIYWFNRIIWSRDDDYLSLILEQIKIRFEGTILPYIPQWQFFSEVQYLDKMDYLVWNDSRTEADIVYFGDVVGHYTTPETIRENKLNDIFNESI